MLEYSRDKHLFIRTVLTFVELDIIHEAIVVIEAIETRHKGHRAALNKVSFPPSVSVIDISSQNAF